MNKGSGVSTGSGSTLTVGGAIETDNRLISTVATGTSPLAVTSTTVCTNLNADLLDGYPNVESSILRFYCKRMVERRWWST